MASIAHDTVSGQAGPGTAAKAPLSTHPAFPVIVGLWFAALLGIGSLVIPVAVIERLVEITGISAIVPQTAPPLGFTARALIALLCTVGGGLAGLVIARKVGQSHRAPPPRKTRGQAASRRPISAHDELGAEGLDGNAPRGRRALAIAHEEEPSEIFEVAPLPGKVLPLSALDLTEAEALDLAEAEALEPEEEAPLPAETQDMVAPGFTTLADAVGRDDFSMADRRHFKLDSFGQSVGAPVQPRQQFILDPAPEAGEDDLAEQPSAEDWDAAPVEADLHFSPPSLARPFAPPAFTPVETEEAEMDDFAEPARTSPATPRVAGPEQLAPAAPATAPAAPADWEQAEPEDLALVQLAQRLGSSIARRREQRAAAAAAAASAAMLAPVAPPAKVLNDEFDAAEAAEAARAMAAYFGSAATSAQALPETAEQAVADSAPAQEAQDQTVAADPVVTPLAAPGHSPAVPPAARQVFRPVEAAPAPQPAPLANLAHIDLGEDDEEDDIAHLTASFSLPLTRMVSAQVEADEADEDGAEEIVAPGSAAPAPFANPFQRPAQPFVRIEDEPQPDDGMVEPAVVFPGEGREEAGSSLRTSAEENERALREALLSLQRMSGAA